MLLITRSVFLLCYSSVFKYTIQHTQKGLCTIINIIIAFSYTSHITTTTRTKKKKSFDGLTVRSVNQKKVLMAPVCFNHPRISFFDNKHTKKTKRNCQKIKKQRRYIYIMEDFVFIEMHNTGTYHLLYTLYTYIHTCI